MHNFFLHKNILIFRRFFNSANRFDYIFGKRSNSSAVSYEREQKIQANSDRSDIRVFETGISPQRHGNIGQSSRAAEEEECNRLISIAKENNLYCSGSMGLSL